VHPSPTRGLAILFVMAMPFIAIPVSAAEQPAGADDRAAEARERLDALITRLNLTPGQIEALRPIVQKEAEELRGVKAAHPDATTRREKMTMLRELKHVADKYEDQIAKVMTPEQMAEWKKMKDERRQRWKEERAATRQPI